MAVTPALARIEIWRGTPPVKQIDDISERIIDKMTVTLPLLDFGISGATMKLINEDGVYTGEIHKFDIAKIFLWRQDAIEKRIFEGRVMKVGGEGNLSRNEFYINLECEDYAQETIAPPQLLNKIYKNTAGKTILTDIVALLNKCTSITHIDPDNDITSYHDIERLNVIPYNAIVEICKNAQSGVDPNKKTGFDAYCDPDGNIHVFKRGKYLSGETLEILKYTRDEDVHPIRNKIHVYGQAEKTYPPSIDALCQEVVNTYGQWTSALYNTGVYGTHSRAASTEETYVGSQSIKFTGNVPDVIYATGFKIYTALQGIFTFNSGYKPDLAQEHSQTQLQFWIWRQNSLDAKLELELYDGAYTITKKASIAIEEDWTPITVSVGIRNDLEWLYYLSGNIGKFDWGNIERLKLSVNFPTHYGRIGGAGSFYIDGLHFGKGRFASIQEDSSSQATYKVRMKRPIIDDDLRTDSECEKRAKLELRNLKDAIDTIRSLTVIGNNNLTQGHIQNVVIIQENLNANFRILEVKHLVRYTTWETELMVNMA